MDDHPAWDDGTKTRLIEAAGREFARHGFRAATIRTICARARAGIGAVNYHFRGKKGLYAAVFDHAHLSALARYPHDHGLGPDPTPAQRLRAFIRAFLLRGLGGGFPAWHGRLVAQEMADPSGVLGRVLELAIRPMHAYLEAIIRDILESEGLPPDGGRDVVRLCGMSVVGACMVQIQSRDMDRKTGEGAESGIDLEGITEKIYQFSLGGILYSASLAV